jgi:hypothetical protein
MWQLPTRAAPATHKEDDMMRHNFTWDHPLGGACVSQYEGVALIERHGDGPRVASILLHELYDDGAVHLLSADDPDEFNRMLHTKIGLHLQTAEEQALIADEWANYVREQHADMEPV